MNAKHTFRNQFNELLARLSEPRRFIQALIGPRQVGKTTILKRLADENRDNTIYASADEPSVKGALWIEQHWLRARQLAQEHPSRRAYLILDEERIHL